MQTEKTNNIIQWVGAVTIVIGHILNAIGPAMYPYNIIVFAIGAILFLVWSMRVINYPQAFVNVISLLIGFAGLVNAFKGA